MRLDDWLEEQQAYEASDDVDGSAVYDDEVEIETPNEFAEDAVIVDEDLGDESDEEYASDFEEEDDDAYEY